MNDRVVSSHDLLDCPNVCKSTKECKFLDMFGNTIRLHGCHVSFSLVLTLVRETCEGFDAIPRNVNVVNGIQSVSTEHKTIKSIIIWSGKTD